MEFLDYMRFLGGFLVVLGLIGALAWAARRFDLASLMNMPARGAGTRLGIVETRMIDPRRRLVLISRDGVGHLLLLGAGTETVVETGIPLGDGARLSAKTPRPAAGPTPTPKDGVALATSTPGGAPDILKFSLRKSRKPGAVPAANPSGTAPARKRA